MISAVIVDDEPKAIHGLTWELTNFNSEIHIDATFSDPEKAINYLNKNTPDCLFLDIQMPTMDGFQFLGRLANRNFAVVITTAYDEYAIKALKHEAIDYLLKPVDSDDLEDTIKKIRKFNGRMINSSKFEKVLHDFHNRLEKKKISINADGKLIFIDEDELIYVESDGNYCTLMLNSSKRIVVTKKLKEVDAILKDHSFFRIHNSYIVNLNKIKEFIKNDGYVVMDSGDKIPVARQRKSDFLEKL